MFIHTTAVFNLIKCSIYLQIRLCTHIPFPKLFLMITCPKNLEKYSTAKYVLFNSFITKRYGKRKEYSRKQFYYCSKQKSHTKSNKNQEKPRKIDRYFV